MLYHTILPGRDNEYGRRAVSVPPFTASALLVSNAEFLPFVLVCDS
jgi:hypothetical protein